MYKLLKLFNPRYVYRRILAFHRMKTMRVGVTISRNRNILINYIKYASIQYPQIMLSDIFPASNVLFSIKVRDYQNNDELLSFYEDFLHLCILLGYEGNMGYSNMSGEEEFFVSISPAYPLRGVTPFNEEWRPNFYEKAFHDYYNRFVKPNWSC